MSTWSVTQIAKWAGEAGFTGDNVATAVAVAVAATGGADHHVSNPSYTPELERRGLWALRASECPGWNPVELFVPSLAAKAAYAAWRANGGTWSFHPAWASGAAWEALPTVRGIMAGELKATTDPTGHSFARMLDHLARFRTAMAQQTRRA